MDNYHDLPEQSLTTLIQLSNNHPDKIKLIDFINSLAKYELSNSRLQLFVSKLIHLCATHQQDNLFWLIYTICENAPYFRITEQKNALGDCVIHTILRYSPTPNLLEGLLAHDNALVQQLNFFQETPLHVFITTLGFNSVLREKLLSGNHPNLYPILETLSPNLFVYNKQGYSPLHLCAFYGLDKELDFLLTQFPDTVNYPTAKNNTCLLIAAKQGHVTIIDILIKHRANLLAITHSKHNTALHLAAQKGYRIICEKLLRAELPLIKNKQEQTPLDLAKQNHHHDSFSILLNHENNLIISKQPNVFTPLYTNMNIDTDPNPIEFEFSPKELILNTFLMGITLGYDLAYQKIPEGKLIDIKNEFNQTALFYAHQLYNTAGLISHMFMPYQPNTDKLIEVYVTFQGTNDTDALHRDIEHKGPGYQSYKQKETDLIARFFKLLAPIIHAYPNKVSITIAGHSLGGGDSFYFLQSLLKVIAKQLSIPTSDPLKLEKLIAEKTFANIDDITGMVSETEKLLLQKSIIPYDPAIFKINRVRIIALNPVGLPKSADHALEGLARYLDNNITIDSFVLRSDGDFAQRMSDRVPLCHILPQYATVNLLLVPGDHMAIQKASACYLGATSLNPSNTPTNMLNIGTDIAALATLGGMTLGPLGLFMGLAAGGTRLYASDKLKQWGRQVALKPHSNLLPNASPQDITLLEKVTLLSNTDPEHAKLIQEIGQNLSTTAFEKFITKISKRQLAENLKTSYF